MTYTIQTILIILIGHWVFDFILQSHWMASNKSKSNKALLSHVGVYTIGVVILGVFLNLTPIQLFYWVFLNGFLHFITDYITSRITSKLFNKDWHNFFLVIGADQLIHYSTLFITLGLIKN